MKIQGKVLSLAWNPVLENHLSFTTNEGRVCTYLCVFLSNHRFLFNFGALLETNSVIDIIQSVGHH